MDAEEAKDVEETTIGKVPRVEAKIPRGGGATRNNNIGFGTCEPARRGPASLSLV